MTGIAGSCRVTRAKWGFRTSPKFRKNGRAHNRECRQVSMTNTFLESITVNLIVGSASVRVQKWETAGGTLTAGLSDSRKA